MQGGQLKPGWDMTPEQHLEICKLALSDRLKEISPNWAFVFVAELPDGLHVKSLASKLSPTKGQELLSAINEALAKIPPQYKAN